MLCLWRKLGESIRIGEQGGAELNTDVRILKINGNQVQLGITAPDHIKIMREEVVEKYKET